MRETSLLGLMKEGPAARFPRIGGLVPAGDGAVHYLTDGPAERSDDQRPAVGTSAATGAETRHEATVEPVVLLHGASGNLRDFAVSLMPALARTHRAVALDRPGFGHSAPVPGGHRLDMQILVLRRALRRLGHYRFHLVGHSYAGAVILAWALKYPDEVASLTLIGGASMDWGGTLEPFYRIGAAPGVGHLVSRLAGFVPERKISATLKGIFAPAPVPPHYREQAGIELALRARTFRLNARSIATLHREILARQPHYGRIACPVTIIHGMADKVVPARTHAVPLAATVRQARLKLIEEAGHMPHHSHVEEVTGEIAATVARAGLSAPRN
ncbi:MAG: alpha/beta hydrolase [Pseudomonadota bacterium]